MTPGRAGRVRQGTGDEMNEVTAGTPGGRVLPIAAVVVAGVAQLVVLVPFTVASGLVAPAWAIAVLIAMWIAFAFAFVRSGRGRPLRTRLGPVARASP